MPHFQKVREVGSGTYGKALLVEDDYHKQYIMKIIDLTRMDLKSKKAAQNEAQVLAGLGPHPFIIRYYKSYIQGNKLYIMMDFAEGGDLYSTITRHKESRAYFPESKIIKWFTQACLALQFLHKHHILHRDLKSQNIFLGSNNQILLGDFGISKTLKNSIDLAETKIGTPYYISPELCKGQLYSYPADIWALGCVLYEMTTLLRPFDGSSIAEVVHSIQNKSILPIPKQYSTSLAELCRLLLTKDPNNRPSIQEILDFKMVKKQAYEILDEIKRNTQHH